MARRAWLLGALGSAACVLGTTVSGCGPQGGAGAATRKRKIAGSIDLPPGVFWDVESKLGASHSPRCTLENDGADIVLRVEIGFEQTADHYLEEVCIVGPGPSFTEVLRYKVVRRRGKWKHEFRIARESLPEAARYLIVYETCNRHGSLGVSQAI